MQIKAVKATASAKPTANLITIAIQSVIGIEVGVKLANAIPALGNE